MESEFRLKDFHDIHTLCSRRADSFCLIGDHFCQLFRGREVISVCLSLIACYQECSSLLFVTQRLIIVYLIYRLKDVGRLDDDTSDDDELVDIRNHPFLLIFVKIYADYRAKGKGAAPSLPTDATSNVILPLMSGFPPITPQEAQFVGRILSEPAFALKLLFRMSPANIADKAVSRTEIDITEHINFIESQLERFRVFGRDSVHENIEAKGLTSNLDQTMLNHYSRLVYSLVSPPFVRIDPSVMPPCVDEFRFIYPSLIAPEPVMDDWLRDEEWKQEKMRPIEKTQTGGAKLSNRKRQTVGETSAADGMAAGYGASPILDAILLQSQSTKSSSFNFNKSQGSRSLASSTPSVRSENLSVGTLSPVLMPHECAVESLTKLLNRTGNNMSKTDINRLMQTVSDDPDIFSKVAPDDTDSWFADMVEYYPDLAAELLFYELKHDTKSLAKHFDALMGLQFSVQSLVAINKFISTCESKELEIPADFLNRFITHCMESCEQTNDVNSLIAHRLVRMVCVFFTTLIRMKGFDPKPRLTEMQNFALIFLSQKEASTLYQTTLQIE